MLGCTCTCTCRYTCTYTGLHWGALAPTLQILQPPLRSWDIVLLWHTKTPAKYMYYFFTPSTQSYMYMHVNATLVHVHVHVFGPSQLSCLGSSVGRALCLEYRVSWVRVPPEAAHFSRKSDCLGCAVLLCLVCLFALACFFLSSFSSLI